MARKMKPSGVDWIGDIPVDWNIKRVKHLAKIQLGKMVTPNSVTENSTVRPYYRAANITNPNTNLNSMWFTPKDLVTYALREHDVLLVEGGNIGFPTYMPKTEKFIGFQNSVLRLSNSKCQRFLYYVATALYHSGLYASINAVSIPHLTKEKLEDFYGCDCTVTEQIAIAAYLDDRTKAIDSKIQLLEEKSTALAELRKSVIHQAVTKGLDSNVAMKPSGVDWIGDIPVHWNNSRVKKVVEIIKGKKPHLFIETTPSRQCYLSARVIRGTEEPQYVELTDPQAVKATKNDILIIMDGSNSGEVFTGVEGIVSSTMGCLKYKTGITKTMLMYLLDLLFESFNSETVGAAIPHLNKNTFYDASLALPSIDEQQVITNYLDERTAVIDESIKTITEQIAALKDLRQSLIYEAVTGKIDVADFGYVTV